MRTKPLIQRDWLALGAVWIAVQGLSLTYPSVMFWDDYMYYADGVVSLPKDVVPNPGRSQIEALLLSISPGSFRMSSFVLLPFCSILLFRILGRAHGMISEGERRLISAIFLLYFPWALSTLVSLTMFNYVLALTGFLIAWNAITSTNAAMRWLIAPLFFVFSFRLPSLILFSIFPLMHTVWLARRTPRQWAERGLLALFTVTAGYLYFPILEVFGYTFKAGYNDVVPSRLAKGILLLLLTATASLYLFFKHLRAANREPHQPINVYFCLALASLMFGVAAFPYLITGHLTDFTSFLLPLVPGSGEYGGRHLILFGFPVALLLTSIAKLIMNPFSKRFSQLLVAVIALLGASNSIEWKLDALKQQAVIQALSEVDSLASLRYVFVDDRLSSFNSMGRDVRSYEIEGWLRRAGGNSAVVNLHPSTSVCETPIDGKRITVTSSDLSRIQALVRNGIAVDVSVTDMTLCHN
jgi:hypothetical protein